MSFSTFAEMELEYGVKLPVAAEASKWKKAPDALIINIPVSGQILVNKEKYDLDSLEKLINGYMKQNPKMSIAVRGDTKLQYREISKILGLCSRNRISNITFATLESE